MAYTPSPNSGSMSASRSNNPKAPAWNGSLTIEGDVLDHILACVENGDPVKIELAAWEKQGPKGAFLSLQGKLPFVRQEEAPNRYAKPEPSRGEPGPASRYRQTASREPAPEYKPVRGGIAERAMGRPIMTTRGPYPTEPASGSARSGSQQNRQFRQELNDDLPDEFD